MKTKITLMLAVCLCLAISCNNSNGSQLSKEEAYQPFAQAMILSKSIVQEVLIAAYQNPDLNDFGSDITMSRSDCPLQEDQDPDVFPKTLLMTYGGGCTSEGGTNVKGDILVMVTDKIGEPNMEIHFMPQEGYVIDGTSVHLNEENPEAHFKAVFKNGESAVDNYDLFIEGLVTESENDGISEIMNMENATISFEDVNENNDSEINTGPTVYLDDLAVIDFDKMRFENQEKNLMEAHVNQKIKFDLFCDCPLAGIVTIRNTNNFRDTQIVDYTSNVACQGDILVDIEVVDCKE